MIDCGCGPIGGLAILAEMVGPAGRVVGVDFSEPTIQYARSVMAALGLENVELVAGDIHELDAATLGGPFDLAFTRAFLMHQADPVRTLGRIAGLVRPGGWIIAHEPLATPPPRSLPHLGALETYWDLLHEVMERAGVARGTVERLQRPDLYPPGSSSTFTAPVRAASFSASTASSHRSSGNRCVITGVRSKPSPTKSK